MGDDANGNYTKPDGTTAVDGQVAMASQHNRFVDDAAAALSRRLSADGRKPWTGNQNANGFRVVGSSPAVAPNDYVTLAQMQEALAAVAGVPTGTVVVLTGMQIPAGGYAVANGQSRSRTTDAALWAFAQASGNLAESEGVKTAGQYGPGDGSTTFTLPNLYGAESSGGLFIRPISSGRGIGTVQDDAIKSHGHAASFSGNPVPPHSHNNIASSAGGGSGAYVAATALNTPYPPTVSDNAGGHTPSGTVTVSPFGGSETRPKNVAYPVLIKT